MATVVFRGRRLHVPVLLTVILGADRANLFQSLVDIIDDYTDNKRFDKWHDGRFWLEGTHEELLANELRFVSSESSLRRMIREMSGREEIAGLGKRRLIDITLVKKAGQHQFNRYTIAPGAIEYLQSLEGTFRRSGRRSQGTLDLAGDVDAGDPDAGAADIEARVEYLKAHKVDEARAREIAHWPMEVLVDAVESVPFRRVKGEEVQSPGAVIYASLRGAEPWAPAPQVLKARRKSEADRAGRARAAAAAAERDRAAKEAAAIGLAIDAMSMGEMLQLAGETLARFEAEDPIWYQKLERDPENAAAHSMLDAVKRRIVAERLARAADAGAPEKGGSA